LSAVMAHELRNPLGVIFNSLSSLRKILAPQGDTELLLTIVGEEADRLNRIVGDLLDFARPYEATVKPVSIEQVLASAIEGAMQSLPANIKVVTEMTQAMPSFAVDGHMLRQALMNLVINAGQAMPRG